MSEAPRQFWATFSHATFVLHRTPFSDNRSAGTFVTLLEYFSMFMWQPLLVGISFALFFSGPVFSIDDRVQMLELDFPVRLNVTDEQKNQAVEFWKSIVKFAGDEKSSTERLGAMAAIRELEEESPIDLLYGSVNGHVCRINALLSLTESGRAFLRVVLPMQNSFSVTSGTAWETWEEAIKKSSKSSADPNGWYSPIERRVYYDARLPIISVVGTYIHEWVHAADHFYGAYDFIYGKVRPDSRIAAEHKAYRLSTLLESELAEIVQNYELARAWSGIRHGNAPRNMSEFLEAIDKGYKKSLGLTKQDIEAYGQSVNWDAYDFTSVEWWKPRAVSVPE